MINPSTIWSCQNLNKTFPSGGFSLSNINLSLNQGEITGVVGENGNGKTTLLRIIAGDLDTDSGKIEYEGRRIISSQWRQYKESISYIPQRIPKWFGYLKTNLIFQASIHDVDPKEIDERLEVLLEELGLTKYADLKWSQISTGYRLRFQLAKMLINRPKLLILDEPIANLDVKAQDKFLSDLQRIVTQDGFKTAVVLSSQQLHQVESFSDNIVFIQNGDIKYSGSVENVGQDRETNSFELSAPISELELLELFGDRVISVSTKGKVVSIEAKMELTKEDFIQSLVTGNIGITYFRDISSSTKKMFK
ncbi:MAG: ABC transporter ATP-binding protein [Flavobacteriales bacterium]|nr:ABC transporter ATP-binding protein [Flavobacteriales bacterium]